MADPRYFRIPMHPVSLAFAAVLAGLASLPASAADPTIHPEYSSDLSISEAFTGTGQITQMAWGPDGRLYASRISGGAVSLSYDAATGRFSDLRRASSISGVGIGFLPGRGEMYQTSADGSIWRLTRNASTPHLWGGPGATQVAIVTGIPQGDHSVDQIQIRGNTLYVGIGTRTINGGTGPGTGLFYSDVPGDRGMASGGRGTTFGESAYGGTISTIKDLSKVASVTDAARLLGPISEGTIRGDASPYGARDDKLVVHSAGTRNPFGLAIDRDGDLYFSNNYNRATSIGDGTSRDSGFADAIGDDLSTSVHDQFFKAVEGGDYGYRNDNWRGRSPVLGLMAGRGAIRSITPDSLYLSDPTFGMLHDPGDPVGLGPSSSADGFDFWYNPLLPSGLVGDAFLTRFTGSVRERSPGTDALSFGDLVAVDPETGEVRRIASGFDSPLAVLADPFGRLLVADFGAGNVYAIQAMGAPTAVPEPSTILMLLIGLPLAAVCRRRPLR